MSDGTDDAPKRRRLRVPVALAVAFVGSAGAVSVWYGGCHDAGPGPIDAGPVGHDNRPIDAGTAEEDAPSGMDAGTTPDAPRDAAPPPDAPDH